MTSSCPETDPQAAPPVTPLAGPPGFTVRQSHTDGAVHLEADLGVEVGRLVDKLVLYTSPGQILTGADVVGGQLRLTITRPAR